MAPDVVARSATLAAASRHVLVPVGYAAFAPSAVMRYTDLVASTGQESGAMP